MISTHSRIAVNPEQMWSDKKRDRTLLLDKPLYQPWFNVVNNHHAIPSHILCNQHNILNEMHSWKYTKYDWMSALCQRQIIFYWLRNIPVISWDHHQTGQIWHTELSFCLGDLKKKKVWNRKHEVPKSLTRKCLWSSVTVKNIFFYIYRKRSREQSPFGETITCDTGDALAPRQRFKGITHKS